MATMILGKKAIQGMLKMGPVIEAVEQAFREWTQGKGVMPAKTYVSLDRGDFRAMPAALPGAAGIKWVNVHPCNPAQGLPTVMAVLILNDPDTGYPLAVMDATEITAYRTGAAGAIASKYLARPNSQILGVIGAGKQAYAQILAHSELFRFKEIRVYDILPDNVSKLVATLPRLRIVPSSLEEAAAGDIVCTVTPARQPVLKKGMVLPGTHINAVGADAEGKEELEPSLLFDARVVVDDLRQASHSGEINVPIAKGLYSASQVYSTLGEIVSGCKPGRSDKEGVTIFDSTGIAIEDIAIARQVYDQAKVGEYPLVELV